MYNTFNKTIETPIGEVYVVANKRGITLLCFSKPKNFNVHSNSNNKHIDQLETELKEYFEGKRKIFDVSLDIVGTDFQKQIWEVLQKIPYGQTISYKEQAINAGKEKAVRAVASANGKNKLVILIPCHRVISSNGSLGGFSPGMDRKEWLLKNEKK